MVLKAVIDNGLGLSRDNEGKLEEPRYVLRSVTLELTSTDVDAVERLGQSHALEKPLF